jgi:hypothetical protein
VFMCFRVFLKVNSYYSQNSINRQVFVMEVQMCFLRCVRIILMDETFYLLGYNAA